MKHFILPGLLAVLTACGQQADHDGDGSTVQSLNAEFDKASFRATLDGSDVEKRAAAPARQADKGQVVVYYAVDSEEPFMQAAVDYEVRSLRDACKPAATKINWVALLNTHYVNGGKKFLVCKAGKLSQETFGDALRGVIAKVSAADFDPSKPESAGLTIPLTHDKSLNKMYKKYPLSNPEVMMAALDFVADKHFSPKDYSYVMHLKSHGSSELLLSGLTGEQLAKKRDRQISVLEAHIKKVRDAAVLSKAPLDVRNRTACEARGAEWTGKACYCAASSAYINQFYGQCEWRPGRAGLGQAKASELAYEFIGLGRVRRATVKKATLGEGGLGEGGLGEGGLGEGGLGEGGLGEGGLGEGGLGEGGLGEGGLGEGGLGEGGLGEGGLGEGGLGEGGLGEGGLGFGDVGAAGLGIHGLQADSHFGTSHSAMVAVLRHLKDRGMKFDFIWFESCESKLKKSSVFSDAFKAELDNVGAFFSAENSLWYRTLDWDQLLKSKASLEDQLAAVGRRTVTYAAAAQ